MATGLISGGDGHGPRGLVLRSIDDYFRLGEHVAATQFAPKEMRGKPVECALAMLLGSEIGVGPMAALQGIAVINGKPSCYGDLLLAVVKASPVCEYVHETVVGDGDAMTARCEAKRTGYPEPTVAVFSVADAKRAKLWGKDGPWTQYPTRMLQMRARGFALRDGFPDVLRGVISREEAEDYPSDPEPRRQTPKKSPASVQATVVDAVPASEVQQAAFPASTAVASRKKSTLEQAMEKCDAADSAEKLAEIQIRADQLLATKKLSADEHAKITEAVDLRADFLRTVRTFGGPPSGEEQG